MAYCCIFKLCRIWVKRNYMLCRFCLHIMKINLPFFVVAYFVLHIFLLHYFSRIFVFKFVCIPRLMICFLCYRFTCLACYIILSLAGLCLHFLFCIWLSAYSMHILHIAYHILHRGERACENKNQDLGEQLHCFIIIISHYKHYIKIVYYFNYFNVINYELLYYFII